MIYFVSMIQYSQVNNGINVARANGNTLRHSVKAGFEVPDKNAIKLKECQISNNSCQQFFIKSELPNGREKSNWWMRILLLYRWMLLGTPPIIPCWAAAVSMEPYTVPQVPGCCRSAEDCTDAPREMPG